MKFALVVPGAIVLALAVEAFGVQIPNLPGVLLLAVAYGAYGGLTIGLVGAAVHVLYTSIFFSNPDHLFQYTHDNFLRTLVIAFVAPGMGLMVGFLQRKTDRLFTLQKSTEAALLKLNGELEARVLARTEELLLARDRAQVIHTQLQLSEQRFRDFAEVASDWLWEQDENFRFSYFSARAFDGVADTVTAHLGKTRREVGNAELTEREWQEHEADLLAHRPFRNLRVKRHNADGSIHYSSISGRPYFDTDGKYRGYRGTARDVTAEVLAEQELEQRVAQRTTEVKHLQRQLIEQERLATIHRLTATVSHELRNPLSVIRNSMYVIGELAKSKDLNIEAPYNRGDRSIRRCENIINHLVEYTQNQELKPRAIAIDRWLDELLDEQGVGAGVPIARDLSAGNQVVFCDQDRLRRALVNVLENARQAMESDDTSDMNVKLRAVTVRSHLAADRVVIEIVDTGSGIAPDVMPHIFEPLFSTRAFGTGLGLPLVKRIMELHSGGIEITSEVGKGTVVRLWLPLAVAKHVAA